MFNQSDINRDQWMLSGRFRKKGYDWWWHSFTATDTETKEEVPFFVEFFTINPGLGGKAPILGQDPVKRGNRPSYLMLKAGCWGKQKVQLHRFYGWDEVKISFNPKQGYQIEAPEAFASETKLTGHIVVSQEQAKNPEFMSDAGEITFSLKLKKEITFNVGYGAGSFFRFLKAFDMYWHAEGIKTLVEGTITLDGRTYEVKPETSFGYSDKNWGSDFTTPWVWLSSNDIYSHREKRRLENSAFDIGGGRPVVFHVPLNRKLLGVFDLEGSEKPEFNFSKFWMGVKTIFSKEED